MRQGFYKVAESYILYRAQRTRMREEAAQPAPDAEQESLVVVRGKRRPERVLGRQRTQAPHSICHHRTGPLLR